jgi:hypothetical protein
VALRVRQWAYDRDGPNRVAGVQNEAISVFG